MSFQSYRLRRAVMMDETLSEPVLALILIEYVDWYTGEKVVSGSRHFNNWLGQLAHLHHIKEITLEDGAVVKPSERFHTTIQELEDRGWAKLNKEAKTLTLYSPNGEEDNHQGEQDGRHN